MAGQPVEHYYVKLKDNTEKYDLCSLEETINLDVFSCIFFDKELNREMFNRRRALE